MLVEPLVQRLIHNRHLTNGSSSKLLLAIILSRPIAHSVAQVSGSYDLPREEMPSPPS